MHPQLRWIEQLPSKQQVLGSTPNGCTMNEAYDLLKKLEIAIRDGEDIKKQLILIASIRILMKKVENGN